MSFYGTGGREAREEVGRPSGTDLARICLAALIGIALVALLAVEVIASDDRSQAQPPSAEALTITEYDLLSRAGTIEPTPYWVGRRPAADRFELEKTEGNVFVRYLEDGARPHRRSDSLTVASYPLDDAQGSLERAARSDGGSLVRGDGLVTLHSPGSRSAYVVFGDRPELQIEVYSPRRGEAASLVAAGAVTPLHWTPLGQ